MASKHDIPSPSNLVDAATGGALPVTPLDRDGLTAWRAAADPALAAWVEAAGFAAKSGTHLLLPAGLGGAASKGKRKASALAGVLLGVEDAKDQGAWATAAARLPAGRYRIEPAPEPEAANAAALGWALGGYRFTRYRSVKASGGTLEWPAAADRAAVERTYGAVALIRDLINTAAGDLGPAELADAARRVAKLHKARFRVVVGDDLLAANYPMVHAVGRAASREPRMIELVWGRARDPKVTLVGKGVCFDTGGLDIKPSSGMRMMKKDMGGGAHALGLAHMVMAAGLRVRLTVLIPAVENAVSGNAFRPGDVLPTRHGRTVEIGNTDAEGRLILADALTRAMEDKPDMVLDFATLTGAARVALGPDLPAMFCNDEALAAALLAKGEAAGDPVWRLPLWRPYRRYLDSKVADIDNAGSGRFGGAITAALFLQEFVSENVPWAHFDLYGWNASDRPGRPEGGEAYVIRGAFDLLSERFG